MVNTICKKFNQFSTASFLFVECPNFICYPSIGFRLVERVSKYSEGVSVL